MATYIRKNGQLSKVSGYIAGQDASDITYDNTTSELSATDAQGAIDEVAKPTFTEASTRTNIASGDTFSTILGKIKKFFTDLKTVAFSGSYNDLSDKPTIPTIPGVVSTTANGLAPKVTDTSKFLKGDGTWATPTDTNTTYTVATGDSAGQIKVTPSSGSAYNVNVKNIVKHSGASVGSLTKPIYVDSNGVAQPCTYTLGKSVPSDADFVKNTEYKILDNYLTSEFTVSGSTAQAYASTNVTLPAGTYLLITTTWGKVNGNGSAWLMTFIGGTEICNTLFSDNTNMHQLIYFGVYTSSGAAARFELAVGKGNATSVTVPPYEKYELRAIRLY